MGEAGANPALSRNCDTDEWSSRWSVSQITHPRSVTFPSRQLGADTSTAAGRRREILMTWIPHDLAVSLNVSPVWPAILRAFFVRMELSK